MVISIERCWVLSKINIPSIQSSKTSLLVKFDQSNTTKSFRKSFVHEKSKLIRVSGLPKTSPP